MHIAHFQAGEIDSIFSAKDWESNHNRRLSGVLSPTLLHTGMPDRTYHPQFNWIKQETLQTPNWIFWSPRFCGSTGLRHWRYFFRSTGGPCRNLFGSWFVSEMGTPRKPFGDHQMNIDESYSRTFPIEIIRNDDQVCLPMTKRVHGRCENEMFLLWNAT
jgi:hypothetical protein